MVALGRGARSRLAGLTTALLVAVGLLVACSEDATGPERSGDADEAELPSVTLSFLQLRTDEGTRRALLRVINREKVDLRPTGIGLDWSGYGGRFRQDYDTTIPAGQTRDLRLYLPPPSCADGSDPPYGLVELGSTTVRSKLDAFGRGVLGQKWTRACAEKYVEDRVGIAVSNRWEPAGSGSSSYIAGNIELTRREGTEEVRLPSVRGSVVFDLQLGDPTVLSPGDQRAEVPIELRPARCDDHALAESSHSFIWQAEVQAGGDKPRSVVLSPSISTQEQAYAMLDRACG